MHDNDARLVVAKLTGGLGNQLFQYAAARGVAAASGRIAAIDISTLQTKASIRRYGLDRYALGVPIVSRPSYADDFQRVKFSLGDSNIIRLPVYRENNIMAVDDEFKHLASLDGVFLDGFWQSWKYFGPVVDELRSLLKVPPRASILNEGHRRQIIGSEAVALHVRRTDYITKSPFESFGVCQPDYYSAAIDLLRGVVARPKFFIFSDDPGWCRAHFVGADFVHVSEQTSDPRDDLALMSLCQHFILANSSFAWWGAWLGANERSHVVAPIPWFAQAPHAGDLGGDEWVRLNQRTGALWSREQAFIEKQKVSVIVISQGEPEDLRQALTSVQGQTYRNFIVIVVVDISKKEISPAAERVIRELPNAKLVWADTSSLGSILASTVSEWQGEWIAFLDDRDRWRPDKLRMQVETAYLTDKDIVACRTIPRPGLNGIPELFPPPGPPDCSLEKMAEQGKFIAGLSHTILRRSLLETFSPFTGLSEPHESTGLWRRLFYSDRKAVMWNRLVESITPFLR